MRRMERQEKGGPCNGPGGGWGDEEQGYDAAETGSVELSCTEQGVPVQRQTREADEGGAAGGPERVGMPGWRPADVLRTKCPGRMDGVAVRRRGRLAVEKTGKTVK